MRSWRSNAGHTATPSSKTRQAIVLYDADCGFCRWSLSKLLAWDRRGRLRPVPIGTAQGAELLADLSAAERDASWHFLERDGRRHSGAAAAVPLLRELPAGGPLAGLLTRFPGPTERAYAWVARNRGTLGRTLTDAAKRRAEARIRQRETA